MKLSLIRFFCLVGLCLSAAGAGAENAVLKLDSYIDLMELDGVNKSGLTRGFKINPEVSLTPGPHTLKLRYATFVSGLGDEDFEDQEKYRSKPVTLQIEARAGEVYTLDYTPPKTRSRVSRMDPHVPIRIVQKDGNQVPAPVKAVKPEPTAPSPPSAPASPSPLDMLDYWWKQATPDQQKAFKKKIR